MKKTTRRLIGLISGMVLGLVYSLTANLINAIIMPDIPFYYPWPGPVLLILGSAIIAGIMGLITAWSEETFIGMLISALFGALVSSIYSWAAEGIPPAFLILTFMVLLPRLFLYIPLGVAVQWILRQWQRVMLTDSRDWGKIFVPVTCVIIAFLFGAFSLYAKEIRFAVTTTNEMVQQGRDKVNIQDLPGPLQSVSNFVEYAKGDYTLEVSLEPDRLPVQRPIAEYGKIVSLVIVRHDNGFIYGCIYTPPREIPICGNFH